MRKLPWRSAFYLVVLLYLLLDLRVCQGPLHRKIETTRPFSEITREKALKLGWVAIINQEPVTSQQLDLAVASYLYKRGRSEVFLDEQEAVLIRRAVLSNLIDDILIRQYADGDSFQAPQKEIDAFIQAWESQFHSVGEMRDRAKLQDLSEKERHLLLGRIWSRKRWLEKRISPAVGVSDEDLQHWYKSAVEVGELREPEKVKARHIFISTVEEDSESQERDIKLARQRILEGEDFGEVAKDVSQDARTKKFGGELNWFSKTRLPEDFAAAAFELPVGQLSEPIKTRIGWHIVEITERQPERIATFDETKSEIRAYLENQQRKETVTELLGKLRKVANIVLFTENI